MLASHAGDTGSNPVGGSKYLPVAQLEERPATNREACRFDSCREGQFISVWESLVNPPALEAGDRPFKSDHADQCVMPVSSVAERRALNAEVAGSIPARAAKYGQMAE